mgnify:FL=1
MAILSILLKVCAYVKVKQHAKKKIDRSFLLIGLVFGFLFGFSKCVNIIGSNGLVSGVNGLFQILVGFYIAALAAVTTFDGSSRGYDMDKPLLFYPATLLGDDGNEENINRRYLLSLLFGYLACASLFVYFLGLFCQIFSPIIHEFPIAYVGIMRFLFCIVYCLIVFHILGSKLLGLYFLGYRMNVNNKCSDVPASPKE